jgi:hypothetical protein
MMTKRTYLVFIFFIGAISLFAQTENSIFSSLDSLTFSKSINLHLNKPFQNSLSNINSTSASFTENRWTNSYSPVNASLIKDETTGYWLNLNPSYYPINDFKSLLITGLILGVFKK